MAVNISAKFGKNAELYNGLASIADQLIKQPQDQVTAVVTLRTKFVKEDYDNGGAATPTVKVLQIEPMFGDAAATAHHLQQVAFKTRTGNPMEPTLFDQDSGGDDWRDDDEPGESAAVPGAVFSAIEPASTSKRARGKAQ